VTILSGRILGTPNISRRVPPTHNTTTTTITMPPAKRQCIERPTTPTLPSFDPRLPGTEYDTPHRAGLHSIWAWEEYNGRKPDNDAIFRFLEINRTQGYEILKSDTVRTLNSQSDVNPRGSKRKFTEEKREEVI
jgi:hypothetical protein